MSRLLLISNSTLHGGGYLDHCADAMLEFLGEGVERVLFVPYALHDRDRYAQVALERFERMGLALDTVHKSPKPCQAVREAQAMFIGGGNTFRLLNELYEQDLVEAIRERVGQGMPYMGASAGTNVACASIKTTNDMPIVEPPCFEALGLVPFNINPHYLDAPSGSTHMGETREQRIAEFHEMNDQAVVGLREGSMLWIEGASITLQGKKPARLFRKGRDPLEVALGAALDYLLEE